MGDVGRAAAGACARSPALTGLGADAPGLAGTSVEILRRVEPAVPVGVDQIQHIEVTRDIAQRFNHTYGVEALKLPTAKVVESTARVPGLDGEKMSKSYNNIIELFDTPKRTKKRINSIKTDSTPVEEPKDPETCSVFALYRLFASATEQEELAAKYRAGGMGYGEAKKTLYEAAMDYFGEARQRRLELEQNPDTVEEILQQGARQARQTGQGVLDRVRSACGLSHSQ